MFEFRIINTADGTQVIDSTLKTPYNSLTIEQFQEYLEVSRCVEFLELLKIKERREEEHKRKFIYKLARKVACVCGIM